jgi:hypothetical protein
MLAERLAAQLLSGQPAEDPVAVARRLLAVQGQDPRGARLAIRARSTGLTAADVDRALSADRSLLITWLNRGTLHLIASEDYPWLHALTTPPLPAPRLLGAFDPVLLGWCSREALLDSHQQRIVTVNGLFRPFALVRGRAVATWTMPAGQVVLEPFGTLTRRDEQALRAEAKDVVRFLRPVV